MDTSKKVNIVEISDVLQGEGSRLGRPSVLIRVSGCPLRCQWGNNTCDSYYTSWNPEKGSFSIDDVEERLKKVSHIKDVIITGGEPLASEDVLRALIEVSHRYDKHVTIETAGIKQSEVALMADLISISPKMKNSTPQLGHSVDGGQPITESHIRRHEATRFNPSAVQWFYINAKDCQLKFVVTDEASVEEVNDYVTLLGIDSIDSIKRRVYLMPEGLVKSEIDAKRRWVVETCIATGYNYTDRIHILAYNDARNV